MNPSEWSPPPIPPSVPPAYSGDNQPARGRRGLLIGGGLLATGVVAGAIIGGTVLSSAATTTPSAPSSSSSTAAPGTSGAQAPNKQSTPVRGDEKAVSTEVAAKLKAAALKAVPGGTVYRVETDADGDAYEAHMTKADGSLVTVKFDKNYAVTKVEEGMGAGGPGGGGGHGGGPNSGSGSESGG
jgi:hypothetical protein